MSKGLPDEVNRYVLGLGYCHIQNKNNGSIDELNEKECEIPFHKLLFSFGKWVCPEEEQIFKQCLNDKNSDVYQEECSSRLSRLTYCGLMLYNEFNIEQHHELMKEQELKLNIMPKKKEVDEKKVTFIPKIQQNCSDIIEKRLNCVNDNNNNDKYCLAIKKKSIECFTHQLCSSLDQQVYNCGKQSEISYDECLSQIDTLKSCLSQSKI